MKLFVSTVLLAITGACGSVQNADSNIAASAQKTNGWIATVTAGTTTASCADLVKKTKGASKISTVSQYIRFESTPAVATVVSKLACVAKLDKEKFAHTTSN